jgi:hypothetical protein
LTDCPAITDPNITGLTVGDLVTVIGAPSVYGATIDGGTTPPPQVQADMCSITKTGHDDTKAKPVVVSAANLADLAAGKPEYRGMLVEVDNVTAQTAYGADGGAAGSYGIISLGAVEVHDKFYYKNATTDAIMGGGPVFPAGQVFTKVVGINFLDYGTWCIATRDKCSDFSPKSTDCK